MARTRVFLLAACAFVLGCASQHGGSGVARAAAPGEKVLFRFDGKSLDGFYKFVRDRGRDTDPKKVFTVVDGMIRVSGEEWGCLTTHEEFANYHLIAEFKWGPKTFAPREDRARDNGILIHSTGKDGAYSGIWMRSIECQIIEGGTGDILVVGDKSDKFAVTCPVAEEKQGGSHVYKPGGKPVTIHGGRINWWGRDPEWKDVKDFRGPKDVEKPVGQWNRLEVVADGGRIVVTLNGKKVNEALNCKPQKGRIQIQSEGAEIFFRRFDLIALR